MQVQVKKIDSKYIIQTDKIAVSNAELQAMNNTGSAGTFKQLVKDQAGNYVFKAAAGAANVTDQEGTTIPEPTETDKRNEYRDKINPELEKIRKQKRKEFRENLPDFTPDEDVDI